MSSKIVCHLVKPKRRNSQGRLVCAKYWRVRYKLRGQRRWQEKSLGVVDKQTAEAELSKFRVEHEHEAAGIVAPKPLREAAGTPMSEHLREFLEDRRSRGRDKRYVYNLDLRLTRLLDDCGWKYPRDVTQDSFAAWRAGARDHDTGEKLAAKTLNDYLDAVVALLRWMQQRGRIISCPLIKSQLRVDGREAEKKVRRRALTDDEARRLLDVAGKHRRGRYKPVILAALLTGLRHSELKALQWGDVHLEALKPFLSVRATTTKNGKPAAFLLRDDLVDELRRARPIDASETDRVCAWVPNYRTFRRLLKRAGIALNDASGRKVDFHALRKTYNTNLHRAGVSEAVHMQLMRVTDRRLIDKTYLDASQLPILDALERLPRFETGHATIAVATGTNGADLGSPNSHTRGQENSTHGAVLGCPQVSCSVSMSGGGEMQNRPENPSDCARLSEDVPACPGVEKDAADRSRTCTSCGH